MTDDKSVRTTREPPVGDEGHIGPQSNTHNGRGGGEHFGHSRTSLGSFVADNDHVTLVDEAVFKPFEHQFFRIEYPSSSGKDESFFSRDLGHCTIRAEVATHDADVSRFFEGLIDGLNDALTCSKAGECFQVFGNRLAGDGHTGAVKQSVFEQVLHHGGGSTNMMQIFHDVFAAGLEIRDVGDSIADRLKVINREGDIDRTCHGDQVQDRIRRSAGCHNEDHRIFKGGTGHDVAGLQIHFEQLMDRLTRCDAFPQLQGIFGRDRRAVGEGHPHGFNRRGHGVGGIHAAASTRSWAAMFDDRLSFFVGDLSGNVLAITLKSRNNVKFWMQGDATGLDGSAVDHECRTIQSSHRHDAAGHVFIAAGDGNIGIVPLCGHDGFDAVRDDVARLQRVRHAVGPHGDPVADPDRIEPHPPEACGIDPLFDFFSKLVEVHIARVAVVPDAGNPDLCLIHVFTGHAGGVEHGLRGPLRTGLSDSGAVFVELRHLWFSPSK